MIEVYMPCSDTQFKNMAIRNWNDLRKSVNLWGQIWGRKRAGGMIWGDRMTNIVR